MSERGRVERADVAEMEIFHPLRASLSSTFALTDGQETLVPESTENNGQMSHSSPRPAAAPVMEAQA